MSTSQQPVTTFPLIQQTTAAQKPTYISENNRCAYYAEYPGYPNHYLMFEKIYDASENSESGSLPKPDIEAAHRWIVPDHDNFTYDIDLFSLNGCYNVQKYKHITTHDVFMVYIAHLRGTTVEEWFNRETIPLECIAITMSAFVPNQSSNVPFAVHFFIQSSKWTGANIPRSSIPLHAFSATCISAHCKSNSMYITSSPNNTMRRIFQKDYEANQLIYDPFQLGFDKIFNDFLKDNNSNKIQHSSLQGYTFPVGIGISIQAIRLVARFYGIIERFHAEIANTAKIAAKNATAAIKATAATAVRGRGSKSSPLRIRTSRNTSRRSSRSSPQIRTSRSKSTSKSVYLL